MCHKICVLTDITRDTDVSLVAGDPLTLTCQLSSDSSVNCSTPFFARPDKKPLPNWVHQRKVSKSAVELVIERVSVADKGRYFCYTGIDNASHPADAITVYVASQFN